MLEVLAACNGGDAAALASSYRSHGELKRDTADAVVGALEPLQARYAVLAADPAEVARALRAGAERAAAAAAPRLAAASRAIGLLA